MDQKGESLAREPSKEVNAFISPHKRSISPQLYSLFYGFHTDSSDTKDLANI